MDVQALDKALQKIVDTKKELGKLDYNNPKYDELEEALHDLEDDFQEEYGDYLETEIEKIQDQYAPNNDVLLPIAYLGEGITIDMKKLPGRDTRLVLMTNPTRLVIRLGKDQQETVWTAQ